MISGLSPWFSIVAGSALESAATLPSEVTIVTRYEDAPPASLAQRRSSAASAGSGRYAERRRAVSARALSLISVWICPISVTDRRAKTRHKARLKPKRDPSVLPKSVFIIRLSLLYYPPFQS